MRDSRFLRMIYSDSPPACPSTPHHTTGDCLDGLERLASLTTSYESLSISMRVLSVSPECHLDQIQQLSPLVPFSCSLALPVCASLRVQPTPLVRWLIAECRFYDSRLSAHRQKLLSRFLQAVCFNQPLGRLFLGCAVCERHSLGQLFLAWINAAEMHMRNGLGRHSADYWLGR